MARLIIGPTTQNSVRIWVRGHERYQFGFVRVDGPGAPANPVRVNLEERHFFTGAADVRGLSAATEYTCSVTFGERRNAPEHERVDFGNCTGRFRTPPAADAGAGITFLFGSCNLHSLGLIQRPGPAYRRLAAIAESERADFMIHCGDQIYYDVPDGFKSPDVQEYREKYLDAWSDSRATRKFLTMLPQYMILDDHEMVNNFSNDADTSRHNAPPEVIHEISLKVYREFVHIRQATTHQRRRYGDQALYYDFSWGQYPFFVLDTRTERHNGQGEIIGADQMGALKRWLRTNTAAPVKFIVTSVPFVGEANRNDDKWNAESFRDQREEIMAYLLNRNIDGVVFLTGDMHCSYHGVMEIANDAASVTVHELMSSPINQIGKRNFRSFDQVRSRRSQDNTFTFSSKIAKADFYDDHSNAMLVQVDGKDVSFEIFRTKRDRRNRVSRTFSV